MNIKHGDIVQIIDGSWSMDSNGNTVWGIDMPKSAKVVGVDPSRNYPTHIDPILKAGPKENNNIAIWDEKNNRKIYTQDRFCVIIEQKSAVRREKLRRLFKAN